MFVLNIEASVWFEVDDRFLFPIDWFFQFFTVGYQRVKIGAYVTCPSVECR